MGEKPTFLFLGAESSMATAANLILTDHVTQLGERAAAGTPIEIVEVDIRGSGAKRLVRVYIDKPGGVTHGDCELISERLGQLLDEQDAIPDTGYTLEVSSPGIERQAHQAARFRAGRGTENPPHHARTDSRANSPRRTAGKSWRWPAGGGNCTRKSDPRSVSQVRKANLKFEW